MPIQTYACRLEGKTYGLWPGGSGFMKGSHAYFIPGKPATLQVDPVAGSYKVRVVGYERSRELVMDGCAGTYLLEYAG